VRGWRDIASLNCSPIFLSPMSLTQLPDTRILGLILEGFDFKECKAVPDTIASLELPLSFHFSCNQEIKIFNNKSMTATVEAKLTAIPCPADLDVSPPLKAMYSLTEDKLNNLVASKALSSAYAPLPLRLLWLIILEHALKKKSRDIEKSADKEKEKDQAKTCSKLLHTLQLDNPFEHKMGEPDLATIPTIYLVHIASKVCCPLTFFTNECIENVNFSPQSVVTKQAWAWGLEDTLTEKVQMLDMHKMTTSGVMTIHPLPSLLYATSRP
jgi:hypothetical protein